MKYKLDNAGYVCAVSFGCYLDNCAEYKGAVPTGYNNLDEWSTYACIQAYYIDSDGDLVLDSERLNELQTKQAQEAIDNAPLYRKDLYENDEVLDSQYIRQTETGKVIVLEDIKTIAPRVFITDIDPYEYSKLTMLTHGKNMMPCTLKEKTVSGVRFTRNYNGAVSVVGKATANIEYVISECNFALKANENYYLNLGGLNCELRFIDDGEISQQYIGASGLINVPRNIEVSQVIIKISNGQTVNTTFYPQLEYGNAFTSYAEYKCKMLEIDFSSLIAEALFPDEELYPSDTLYPRHTTTINYILIENGSVAVSVDGIPTLLSGGAVGLFGSYSTIYANKDVTLEVTYSSSLIAVDSLEFLQGKSTTTNRFRILKDGSIEAHNGYFSGRIEADSGYFKGEISWEQVTGNEDVATKTYVEGKGYQNAIQVTQITKDTVTAPFVKTLGLTVGNEIQMGENATISWANVSNQPTIPTNTNQLTNGAGYQTASQVTQITKDTVTTSFVNALKVVAGSVDAENITGEKILGKKFVSNVINSSSSGFVTTIDGHIIKTTHLNGSTSIQGATIEVGSTLDYTKIEKSAIESHSGTSDYTTISGKTITSDGGSTYGKVEIAGSTVSFSSLKTAYIKHGSTTAIELSGNTTKLSNSNVYLGALGGKLAFFGASTGSAKQSVTTITSTSTATASTVATKLNELLTALKAYNLIG